MGKRSVGALVAWSVAAAVLSGCGSVPSTALSSTAGHASSSAASGVTAAPSAAQQQQYCTDRGGQVQTRQAYWGTNGDQSNWLALAGTTTMCRFQADDEAKSRIYVDLTTLSSPQPTLAALAYLSRVPLPPSNGGANPATGYCSNELDGSSTFGGVGASGGGWVAKDDPDDVVIALCVFPDQSFIDEWGLAYHVDGTVRGTDLVAAMAYQPGGALPPVFSGGSAAPTTS